MSAEPIIGAVQRWLNAVAGRQPAEWIVRALLDRSARRLQLLCSNSHDCNCGRLTLPSLNLQPGEWLRAVGKRLLKTMFSVRRLSLHAVFTLVNQPMRRELHDLPRRLDV
jgi:RNA polymerase sigma-70 factor (ECF subfamily)